jgi:predicted ATPase/DNA-binding CsgD family transcriptional regulator
MYVYNAVAMPRPKLSIVPGAPALRRIVPNNLPVQRTSLIGRDRDIEAALAILSAGEDRKSSTQMLTIVGPGGVGKTRLALQVAEETLDDFPDGVFLVELAAIIDPELLVPAIAAVLELREVQGSSPLATLVEHLQNKRILLVLDNFEQLMPARAVLERLMASCPDLSLLVTSRSSLRLGAEHVFEVPPLSLPATGEHLTASRALQYGAAALFAARAGFVDPDFRLTDSNVGAVAEVCRKVDGLPLAIELVAAHARLLSPQSMLARLTHPLRLLSVGAKETSARHKTIRDTIEWSYQLLREEEQRLFRRLSVFVGGFSLRAAESVCNEAGDVSIGADHALAIEVLEGLEAMVDNSLVKRLGQVEEAAGSEGDRRLAMLETVREYAREQLAASGEAEAVQQRHADYYLALSERIGPGIQGPEQAASRAVLAAEQDNMRAALQWLLEREEPGGAEDALRLIRAVHPFWEQRMHLSEFRGWLDRALAQAGPRATPLLAWALQRAASLARWHGDFEKAKALGEQSLAMATELGDDFEIANALNTLGGIALYQSDHETAAERSGEALARYRRLGAEKEVAQTLGNLGLVALYAGDYGRAEDFYRECVRLLRESGNEASTPVAMTNLGYAAHYQGDSRRAREVFLETLALTLRIDSQRSGARVLAGLAATILAEVPPDPKTSPQDLPVVEKATQLLGLAAARRERGGGNFDPRGQAEFERNVAAARERLGEEAFTEAWEEGRAMTLDSALKLATGVLGAPDSEPRSRASRQAGRGGLTPREFEVAALVAQGLTNAQIASRLVLSQRTVEMHSHHALQKLGLATRTQLAAWAIQHGTPPDSPST